MDGLMDTLQQVAILVLLWIVLIVEILLLSVACYFHEKREEDEK